MVTDPADYPWSSHRCNAFGMHDPLVSHHASCRSLSQSQEERRERYRAFAMETIDTGELQAIRRHVQQQHAFGTHRFLEAIEAQLGRPAGPVKIGRPRKSEQTERERLL